MSKISFTFLDNQTIVNPSLPWRFSMLFITLTDLLTAEMIVDIFPIGLI